MNSPTTFHILGSSSAGNCGLLTTPQTKILIDAGFSGKRICAMLEVHGLTIADIDAVFLTHEHSDHSQGFRGLAKQRHLTWICNRDTHEAMPYPSKQQVRWSLFETGSRFVFRDLEVDAFSIPHDASDPVGYVFSWGGQDLFSPYRSVAWVLDLGYVTALVKEKIQDADTLIIEANYDSELLELDTKRPWSVKQRIQSRHGHLSNHAVAELLESLLASRVREVHLAHISRDCNNIEAIRRSLAALISNTALPFSLRVFNPATHCSEALQIVQTCQDASTSTLLKRRHIRSDI